MSLPRKWVEHRRQSRPYQHRDVQLTACEGLVKLEVVPSAIRSFEALVVLRCYACARTSIVRGLEVVGVIPEPAPWSKIEWTYGEDDDDGMGDIDGFLR